MNELTLPNPTPYTLNLNPMNIFRILPFLLFTLNLTAQLPAKMVDYREARDGITVLTEEIQIPEEDAGYTLLLPGEGPVKAVIVMFHSGRDTTHPGFEQRLYVEAVKQSVATLYITTGNRFEFLFDEEKYHQLDDYLGKAIAENDLPSDKLVFAGMSLAGTRAMKFGVWCMKGKSRYGIQPAGIVVCDAPLDFVRFWRELTSAKQLNHDPVSVSEAGWVSAVLERNLGGSPSENQAAWLDYSPYSHDRLDRGNAALLKTVPVRAYTEPDVLWWMENRGKDFYAMNAIDAAALINTLRLLGNEKAELILTQNKGQHPDGTRHPHSWSIVDNAELVQWVLEICE